MSKRTSTDQIMKHCNTCRCAGHDQVRLVVGGVTLDLDRHTISYSDRSNYLTAMDARLAWALLSAAGMLLHRDDLYREVWGFDDASTMGRCVDVHIAQLRRVLARIDAPMEVVAVRGVGYRLDVTTVGEEGAAA